MSEAEPSLLLGVDGGNSKTVAVVARSDGTVIGAGRAGPSDIYNAPDEAAALQEVRRAVNDALRQAGAEPGDLLAGAFSMAGADWPEDVDLIRRAMTQSGFGRSIMVVNDAIGALRAGTPDGVGVAVICGTGIAIGARNPEGQSWHSGHWTVAAGGAELGHRALNAVYEAHLDLGPKTSLTDAVLAFFEAPSVEEVLHRRTARGTDQSWMKQARLAPLLLDEAARGDAVAREIVLSAGRRDADVAVIAARAVGLDRGSFRLMLAGGVLRHPARLLATAIEERVREVLPGVELVDDAPEPVVGAVLLASDMAGGEPAWDIRARLVETMPGRWLFAT